MNKVNIHIIKSTTRIYFFALSILLALCGCSIGSDGISVGDFLYIDPGPSHGYNQPPSGLPSGSLGVQITYPPSMAKAKWNQTIWIYGVIYRENRDVNAYPWDGPRWFVDFGKIGEAYYWYDQLVPEVRVRFPFDGKAIGPGQHQVSLQAWDYRGGGSYFVEDTIWLIIE